MGDDAGQDDTGSSFDRRDVLELIAILPARDRDVLRSYYGLDDPPHTDVAKYRVRREAVARLREKMSPEERALFDGIEALRGEIGPVKFDIVESLRELREDGI